MKARFQNLLRRDVKTEKVTVSSAAVLCEGADFQKRLHLEKLKLTVVLACVSLRR